jgi:hypothetical protein
MTSSLFGSKSKVKAEGGGRLQAVTSVTVPRKGSAISDGDWTVFHLIMNKDCKANKDDKMDCNDDCNGGLDCKNKMCLWKNVEVRHTKDGKGSGLFAMEDVDKDDFVIEYMGRIEYKRRENNYMMKNSGMNL